MTKKISIQMIICLGLIILGCSKDESGMQKLSFNDPDSKLASASAKGSGASQVDGVSFLAEAAECDVPTQGATYALRMTGDLEGCLFIFIDEFECSPSGTYREIGREYFVGNYNGGTGSFWTTYKFEAKYEGCAANGGPLGAEIFGRCQHPIVEGSGTGVFAGVYGRLEMKDDIAEGNYPYRGHFRY
jgi:hypothetical protein